MGGTQHHDGANVTASPYSASCQNIPTELQERRYPVLWRSYGYAQDSGGPRRTRGGLGLLQMVEFPYCDGTISCIGDRERFGPPGIFGGGGGEPGGTAGLVINRATEQERNIGFFAVNEPGFRDEVMTFWSAGSGGFGEPLARPAARVLEDVKDAYISSAAAWAVYGVVVDEIDRRRLHFEVDFAATEELRKWMRQARVCP